MHPHELDDMSLQTIMTRWPATLGVFVAWRLHCIGCPIADFHRLADAAREHGQEPAGLVHAVAAAIAATPDPSAAAPVRSRRRSTRGGAGP
jgi:hybrid cluster-associated redox disulfide protein